MHTYRHAGGLRGCRSSERLQEIDHVVATVELDARTAGIAVGPSDEYLEGGRDQGVDRRGLSARRMHNVIEG